MSRRGRGRSATCLVEEQEEGVDVGDGDLFVQDRTRELEHPERCLTELGEVGDVGVSADLDERLHREGVQERGRRRRRLVERGQVGRTVSRLVSTAASGEIQSGSQRGSCPQKQRTLSSLAWGRGWRTGLGEGCGEVGEEEGELDVARGPATAKRRTRQGVVWVVILWLRPERLSGELTSRMDASCRLAGCLCCMDHDGRGR